jgi:hypothetical protein
VVLDVDSECLCREILTHRIDRRCPPIDLRFINASSPLTIHLTHLESGQSSDGVSWRESSRSVPSTPTLATKLLPIYIIGSSDGALFFFFFFLVLTLEISRNVACGIFASLGSRNVYKDMLNNLVSPIDHVVINHQNQTQTNGLWGHVRYNYLLPFSLWTSLATKFHSYTYYHGWWLICLVHTLKPTKKSLSFIRTYRL